MSKAIITFSALFIGFASLVKGSQVPMKPNELSKIAPASKKFSNGTLTLHLTWPDINILSKQLADTLQEKKWVGILAITRGGLIPAGILAQKLGIRRIETINIQSYNQENNQEDALRLNTPNIQNEGENWLVVDDLVDSGLTIRAVKKLFPKAEFAVLVAKPNGQPMADYYVKDVAQNIWIIFPWENN